MKRLLFIFAIVAVLAVVGFYTFMEFSVVEISYVTDVKVTSAKGNEMVLRRLYTSGIDIDKFFDDVESSLVSTEFTEDEIYQAALASGTPEFYPAFYYYIYHAVQESSVFNVSGNVRQEYAENQVNANFNINNLHLELITEGLVINNVKTNLFDTDIKSMNAPIISEDGRSMAINLDNVSGYSFDLTGTAGKATFQFTYDIVTNGIFPNEALTEQLLIVYANISYNDTDGLMVEFISEPYSSLEDLY